MTDADALAWFEALVLSQEPARAPWQPVTDYSFEARKAIEGKHPELIRDVFQPARVLDAGCGPGHLVRLLKEVGIPVVRGCDVSVERGPIAGALFHCDLSTRRPYVKSHGFDLVVCREVLEHLTVRQLRLAVANLCDFSSRFVYVTTRFNLAPQHLLDVMTSDDLDPTHISMLNQDLLRVLFVLEGFKRRADLEQRLDWQNKGRVLVYERAA